MLAATTLNDHQWRSLLEASELARRDRVKRSPAQIAAVLRERSASLVKAIVADADAALAGRLILPGTGAKPYFVGDPPRWHDNPFHDSEYVWALSRHAHFVPLLRAYTLTGDDRYAAKVVNELQDWLVQCPRPPLDVQTPGALAAFDRVDPWRILEAGMRMYLSWPLVAQHLSGTKWMTPAFAGKFGRGMVAHAQALSTVSPTFWPNADHNHLMMEMLGLLHASLLLNDLPEAAHFRQVAIDQLLRCCQNQFTAEGGQIEGCPSYHLVAIEVLTRASSALRMYGGSPVAALDEQLRRGVDYMLHTTRPTGETVPWGDSDAHCTHLQGTLVQAADVLDDPSPLRVLAPLVGREPLRRAIELSRWSVRDADELLAAIDSPADRLPPKVMWHRELDQVSARTGWSRDDASVFFACRIPVNNGHGHIDPAGFDYTALGKALIVDPARFTYREDADRRFFKSAAAHNTITVNGRDPFQYVSTWRYEGQKAGKLVSVSEHPDRITMVCEQSSFEPALHRRTLTLFSDGVLVIADRIGPFAERSTIQRWFHFNSTTVRWDESRLAATTADEDANVSLLIGSGHRASLHPGKISTAIDVAHPSMRLCLESDAHAGQTLTVVAVVVPHREAGIPTRDISLLLTTPSGATDGVAG